MAEWKRSERFPLPLPLRYRVTGTTPEYQTHFKRGDIGASGPVAYVAEVWFLNIDGVATLQATSNQVTF